MFERFRSLAYSFTGAQPALPGLWERVRDDFHGCLILIEENGGLQGRITYVPALMRQYGWKVGDVKWRNISAAGTATFQADDLFKELDPDTNQVKSEKYHAARLCFLSADEFAVIASGPSGRNTRWRRSAHVATKTNSGDLA